jgi:hypothetical protein
MSIKAYRAGLTATDWSSDPYDERLIAPQQSNCFKFHLKMPSKGGGVTEVELRISSESFTSVAEAMMAVNEDAAIRAFGAALVKKSPIKKPPNS